MTNRTGQAAREVIRFEVDRMLQMDVIEPSTSLWVAPVVLAPKQGGIQRFYVDYRELNKLTVRDSYPLPRTEECMDSLCEPKVLSTLDCNRLMIREPLRKIIEIAAIWRIQLVVDHLLQECPFRVDNKYDLC